uniref:ras-specific guanine nucleotide-releasing factor RalGPS1-like n=1 Tax=Myxine glutinosa TaxID=7769 RepID=UPI00358DDC56
MNPKRIYLSDITYIDSAYPASDSILENEQRSLHMNNILRVISDFQQFCHYEHLQQLPHVQKYLHSVQYIEELQKFVEDDNYKQSLRIEPGSSNLGLTSSKEDSSGASDASGSPKAVHRRTTAPEPLVLGSPVSTPPTNRNPCCHRKSRSLGSKWSSSESGSFCPHVGVEAKSMTLPAVRPRHLLDDSVMDLSPLPRPMRGASLASGLSLGSSEGSEMSEDLTCASFDSLMDLDSIASLPSPCVFTIEGQLKRRTLLKEGKRPTVSSWARFWVVLCGACLYYYPAKALRASERKHFKSRPSKKTCVAGYMVLKLGEPDTAGAFQLMDSEHGNVYKFQANSETIARLWVTHLEDACRSNRTQPPDNLMSFE